MCAVLSLKAEPHAVDVATFFGRPRFEGRVEPSLRVVGRWRFVVVAPQFVVVSAPPWSVVGPPFVVVDGHGRQFAVDGVPPWPFAGVPRGRPFAVVEPMSSWEPGLWMVSWAPLLTKQSVVVFWLLLLLRL